MVNMRFNTNIDRWNKIPHMHIYLGWSGFFGEPDWPKSIERKSFFKKPVLLGYLMYSYHGSPSLCILIPVKTQGLRINLFKEFLKNFKLDWDRSEFKTLFPELDEVTKKFQDFKISDLMIVLGEQSKRSSEKFEIFNTKIPAEEVSKWGMFIILGLHLYFIFHLNSFIRTDFKTEEMEIPWIGIYSGIWARIFVILSSIFLPLGLIICLFINHLKFKIDLILLIILIAVVIFDIGFCILTWKNFRILWDRVGYGD
jgi:hypothetical protein